MRHCITRIQPSDITIRPVSEVLSGACVEPCELRGKRANLPRENDTPSGPSVEEICSATYDDPAQVWKTTGAGAYLNAFITKHTADNWTCRASNPPQVFHVWNAITIAHRMMNAMREGLQDFVLVESLNVDQIVADFGPPQTPNLDGILGGAFTIAADIKKQLAAAFTSANEHLAGLTRVIFGGSGVDSLPGAAAFKALEAVAKAIEAITGSDKPTNPDIVPVTNPISSFFANGKFLIKVTSTGSIDTMVKNIRQRLAMTALQVSGHFIFVDHGLGARWIDNECFQIYTFNPASGNNGRAHISRIDGAKIGKFDDGQSNYNLRVEEVYNNANDCFNKHPNYDGDVNPAPALLTRGDSDVAYPECFFPLPVIKAPGTPCKLEDSQMEKLPEVLRITPDNCSDRIQICFPPGPCPA
ncbi:unnamed protein product [Parascedosporium putredinis]|uniref:Uncharacterized protein n=1 Tax=Parascedosporium putredinis TaxID=1442378 RepID=A0A9P1H1P0_9PEZI|nr:unnamed protein product [Parascedosporium putredinis]CAI7993947.1 unnamed protein product [Parascedosporium putredinis]